MNEFEKTIKAYLDGEAEQDMVFRARYEKKMAADKDCIAKCCRYIIDEVKKANRTAWADDEIYGMAAHYIDEDINHEGKETKCRVVVPAAKEKKAQDAKPKRKVKDGEEIQLSLF